LTGLPQTRILTSVSEPTLKDVLEAISGMTARVDRIDSAMATKDDLAALHSEMATRAEMSARFDRVDARFDGVDKRVDARFDRIDKKLDELDKDLDGHMKVHRELEKDIELLKRRPPRSAARAARRR
jgi:hypothetical protein